MKSLNNLRAKLKKQGGFTLVEMLIVVAIIGILVAVSIPAVNSALDKAKAATDNANRRAAFGLAMVNYLSDGYIMKKPDNTELTIAYYKVDEDGQGSFVETFDEGTNGQSTANKSKVIKVVVDATGKVSADWKTSTE